MAEPRWKHGSAPREEQAIGAAYPRLRNPRRATPRNPLPKRSKSEGSGAVAGAGAENVAMKAASAVPPAPSQVADVRAAKFEPLSA